MPWYQVAQEERKGRGYDGRTVGGRGRKGGKSIVLYYDIFRKAAVTKK